MYFQGFFWVFLPQIFVAVKLERKMIDKPICNSHFLPAKLVCVLLQTVIQYSGPVPCLSM
jgi:hypothetical protein